MTNLLVIFNDHFMEFVEDIIRVFPDDADLVTAKNSFVLIRRANPKMIVKIFQTYVVDKYQSKIDAGDISFFIEKDYAEDLEDSGNSDKIIQAINRLRNPVKMMESDDQMKSLRYLQNLRKISALYHAPN